MLDTQTRTERPVEGVAFTGCTFALRPDDAGPPAKRDLNELFSGWRDARRR